MTGVLTAKQMLKEGLDLIGTSQKRMSKQRLFKKFEATLGVIPFTMLKCGEIC